MGKAARNRAERSGVRLIPSADRIHAAPLREAFKLAGHLFGDDPDCAGAAAVLTLMASDLGFHLRPRAVAVVAKRNGLRPLVMGPRATASLSDRDRASLEDIGRPGGRDTGHMILTSDHPPFMYDPNIRQLRSYGVPASSVAMPLPGPLTAESEWAVTTEGTDLHYFVDDENHALEDAYRRGIETHAAMAHDLANSIATGKTFEQLKDRYSKLD